MLYDRAVADDIRLYLFECGIIRLPRFVVNASDALSDERVDNPTPWYLLTHPRGNVVIDGGNAPEVAEDPVKHWGYLAERSPVVIMRPDQALLPELERVGVDPASRWVVQSHLHLDHTGALAVIDRLPNAEVLVTRTEYDTAHNLQSWERAAYARPTTTSRASVVAARGRRGRLRPVRRRDAPAGARPGTRRGICRSRCASRAAGLHTRRRRRQHDRAPQRDPDPDVHAVDGRRDALGAAASPPCLALAGPVVRPRSRRVAVVHARPGVLTRRRSATWSISTRSRSRSRSGYEFSEGPAWSVREQALIFSDIPGDTPTGGPAKSAPRSTSPPTTRATASLYEPGGTYLVVESDMSVSRFTPDGQRMVIASHFEDAELNSPNDIVTRSDDTIYFTDPNYGRWND